MSRKTAAAVKQQSAQPALFDAPQSAKPIAKIETAAKTKKTALAVVASDKPKPLLERLREVSNGKDVAVAQTILAMIRSEEDRQAARLYNEGMLACQTDLPPITRDSVNKHTNSKWAKLEKISRIVDPIIRRHGFVLSYGMATSPLPDHYRVICDCSHRDGHVRRYEADVGMDSKGPKGEGNKSLAQGSGSSVTYARRYLKVMIFDIVIEGEDNDGNVQRATIRGKNATQTIQDDPHDGTVEGVMLINQKQHDDLVEALEAASSARKETPDKTRKAFCKAWHIDKVADLAAEHYATAIKAVRDLVGVQR